MKKVRSPLRYPGGKTRAVKTLLPVFPDFDEYREPMVGGASVFFALKNKYPNKSFWINDLNYDLYAYWKHSKINNGNMVRDIYNIKSQYTNGRDLYNDLYDTCNMTEYERAIRFFIMNRITFSGLSDSGGFSNSAYKGRFTDSSIERLRATKKALEDTKITNFDYKKVIDSPGENVFIFLDPPYLSATKSKLYGKSGDLHESFNHYRFAQDMRQCKHKWLITYDDNEIIRDLFSFANIYEWSLQYGMDNVGGKKSKKGKELMITNYHIK